MKTNARERALSLPRCWKGHARSGFLHAVSIAATAMTVAWSRAASKRSTRSLQAQLDRLRAEIAHLKEEMGIKDSRWHRHSPRRRPHYGPIQRMRILRLRAARGWTVAQTAERFLLTEATIMNWMRRLDEGGEAALVRLEEPVNKFPDFVAHLVRRLKVMSPPLGKVRIAQMLARAGLHLSASTVGRMLKRDLSRDDLAAVMPVEEPRRGIRAPKPNQVWHVDLTAIPTSAGSWTPWFPFAQVQRWPFCWWAAVAVDHASRRLIGFALFCKRPNSAEVCAFMDRAIRAVGSRPKTVIADKGKEFHCWSFRSWCRRRGIHVRFGAMGEHGSIAIVERFIRSMKSECTKRIVVPFRLVSMRRELDSFATWYNEHRPHSGLGGRTPLEVFRGLPPANEEPRWEPRSRWPAQSATPKVPLKGRIGERLSLLVKQLDGRAHLPVVEIRRAA